MTLDFDNVLFLWQPNKEMDGEISLRPMSQADIPFADQLRSINGWNQTLDDWRRLLDLQPDGCFLGCYNQEPVATLTTTCYQHDLAWIGMVLTHPDFRRRGIAGKLMAHALEFLQEKGIACIKLDATPQGKPLYERLGFLDEYGLKRWKREGWNAVPFESGRMVSRPIRESDWDTLIPLDTKAFGVSRRNLLRALYGQSDRSLLILDASGSTVGFGMIRRGMVADYLGPLVSRSFEFIPCLISALTAGKPGRAIFWDIPDSQQQATDYARCLGMEPQRELTRMYYRHNLFPGDPTLVFGVADLATG